MIEFEPQPGIGRARTHAAGRGSRRTRCERRACDDAALAQPCDSRLGLGAGAASAAADETLAYPMR